MGNHVYIEFAGTGISAASIQSETKPPYLNHDFDENVVRIYFSGCQDARIGGKRLFMGYVDPDLDVVATRLRECFNENGDLSLVKLKQTFGDAVIIEGATSEQIEVEDVCLSGFSRGAVTCFATARHLNDLNKPISILAQEPVPGSSRDSSLNPDSEFYKNYDLQKYQNIQHVMILLGMYSKKTDPLHNKYFRQMVPLFNDTCECNVLLDPKINHYKASFLQENLRQNFLHQQGLISTIDRYDSRAPSFYIPKIIQQKFYPHALERAQLSTEYKNELLNTLLETHPEMTPRGYVKYGQALFALSFAADCPAKEKLTYAIKQDRSPSGAALREFIVEFENINQYVLNGVIQPVQLAAIARYRADVYERVQAFPIQSATPIQIKQFCAAVFEDLARLKPQLSRSEYTTLHQFMTTFFNENVLFHPDLTQYIHETETYDDYLPPTPEGSMAIDSLHEINDAGQLANYFYQLSARSRVREFNAVSTRLPSIIKNSAQLGDMLRFFTPNHMDETLKNTNLRSLITSIEDINLIMSKLFTDDQRKHFFISIKDAIPSLIKDTAPLTQLMQYLSANKQKQLIDCIKTSTQSHQQTQTDHPETNDAPRVRASNIYKEKISTWLSSKHESIDSQALTPKK